MNSKAYLITEFSVVDASAMAEFATLFQAAVSASGGENLSSAPSTVVSLTGPAPEQIEITAWDDAGRAKAFLESTLNKSISPLFSRAAELKRRYIVAADNT